MPSNRGVVYLEPGKVEVQNIDSPAFRNPAGKTIEHGVILKVVCDEYLWFRPAHGARPDDGTGRHGAGP
jgi:hypothetical protein